MAKILALLALFAGFSVGAASVPPADMICDNGISPDSPSWSFVQCTFPPHISKYVPANADWDFKAAYLVPVPLPLTPSLKLKLHFDGYSARPDGCTDRSYAEEGYITIKNCPGHYPDVALYAVNGVEPLDWGGIFNGEESNGWRFAATITRANELWGESIDWGAGITLEGDSYGGTTGILQSVILPDQWWRHQISIVNAIVPQTLFVRVDTTPGTIEEGGDGIDQSGGYWRDPAVRLAWGSYDINKADIVKRVRTVQNIYFRIDGSPADTSVVFDIDFFRAVCDDGKVACFGTWHNAGHSLDELGLNLPFSELYTGPDMSVRLDKMLPVFTHSTANWWGPRGHYNLGLEWANNPSFVDSKEKSVVPVRYVRHTNLGGGIPDQPLSVTFDLTLRRIRNFPTPVGQQVNWVLGSQSGNVVVTKAGEVTIPNLTLRASSSAASGKGYVSLILTKPV